MVDLYNNSVSENDLVVVPPDMEERGHIDCLGIWRVVRVHDDSVECVLVYDENELEEFSSDDIIVI